MSDSIHNKHYQLSVNATEFVNSVDRISDGWKQYEKQTKEAKEAQKEVTKSMEDSAKTQREMTESLNATTEAQKQTAEAAKLVADATGVTNLKKQAAEAAESQQKLAEDSKQLAADVAEVTKQAKEGKGSWLGYAVAAAKVGFRLENIYDSSRRVVGIVNRVRRALGFSDTQWLQAGKTIADYGGQVALVASRFTRSASTIVRGAGAIGRGMSFLRVTRPRMLLLAAAVAIVATAYSQFSVAAYNAAEANTKALIPTLAAAKRSFLDLKNIEPGIARTAALHDEAKAVGFSAASYDRLKFAIKQNSVVSDSVFKSAMQTMVLNIREAQRSNESLKKSFGEVNDAIDFARTMHKVNSGAFGASKALESVKINLKDLDGKSAEQKFFKIASAINSVKDQAEKVRLTGRIFGTGNVDIVSALNIKQLKKETAIFRRAGLFVSDQEITRVKLLQKELGRLAKFRELSKRKTEAELAPYVQARAQMQLQHQLEMEVLSRETKMVKAKWDLQRDAARLHVEQSKEAWQTSREAAKQAFSSAFFGDFKSSWRQFGNSVVLTWKSALQYTSSWVGVSSRELRTLAEKNKKAAKEAHALHLDAMKDIEQVAIRAGKPVEEITKRLSDLRKTLETPAVGLANSLKEIRQLSLIKNGKGLNASEKKELADNQVKSVLGQAGLGSLLKQTDRQVMEDQFQQLKRITTAIKASDPEVFQRWSKDIETIKTEIKATFDKKQLETFNLSSVFSANVSFLEKQKSESQKIAEQFLAIENAMMRANESNRSLLPRLREELQITKQRHAAALKEEEIQRKKKQAEILAKSQKVTTEQQRAKALFDSIKSQTERAKDQIAEVIKLRNDFQDEEQFRKVLAKKIDDYQELKQPKQVETPSDGIVESLQRDGIEAFRIAFSTRNDHQDRNQERQLQEAEETNELLSKAVTLLEDGAFSSNELEEANF